MNHDEIRKQLIELCEVVLAGKISLEDFYSKANNFDAGLVDDVFYKSVYLDLEDGVQHTPGYLFKKGIDYDRWRETSEYSIILLDRMLLEKPLATAVLMKCRERFLDAVIIDIESLGQQLDRYISSLDSK